MLEQSMRELIEELGLENFQLAQKVERIATWDGDRGDYAGLSTDAEALSETLRSIAAEHEAEIDDRLAADLVVASRQVEKMLTEAKAIEDIFPWGPSRYQLVQYEKTERDFQNTLQEYSLRGLQLRVAQVRLAERVERLQRTFIPGEKTPFDRRTDYLVGQMENILARAGDRCVERAREILSLSRFVRENAGLLSEIWADYSCHTGMLTRRNNDGSIDPGTFLYSSLREYVLGQLEQLSELSKLTPYLLRLLRFSSSLLPDSAKSAYVPERDVAYDRFFDPECRDLPRNLSDRLVTLARHQENCAGEYAPISYRKIHAHLHQYAQTLEYVLHHFENAEQIVRNIVGQICLAHGIRPAASEARTIDFDELDPSEQERFLDWMVGTASKSAGETDDREIPLRGYFPKALLNKETFRSVLSLEGARVSVAEEAGRILGCAVILHGEVPEGSKALKERYADHVRIGVIWWMNVDPDSRGKGIYDVLNDEMLIDSIGKTDALVGRLKVGNITSTHAFKAHLRRLHIPIGGFEDLPHGLHMHLVSFVSPALRNLYFDYLKIDQDFGEIPSVVQSHCERAKTLENGAGDNGLPAEDGAGHPTSRVARLLLRRSESPWTCGLDPCDLFDAILLFDEETAGE